MERILLVEDSVEFQLLVKKSLGPMFDISNAGGISDATDQLSRNDFDLILLDVTLPDGNGFQFCSLLKTMERTSDVPVIMLTGKDASSDKVMGFSLGADDYIVKPFDPFELKARVEARLSHFKRQKEKTQILTRGLLQLNFTDQKAFVLNTAKTADRIPARAEKKDLNLTPIEFKLLSCFMRHENVVLTRLQLLEAVLGDQVHVLERTIDKHICSLREKLSPDSNYIRTVFRTGYRFSLKAD
ncbi:MAG: response regulator transcription factor [Methylotenera sp.]|nr:response regulator transcription factor [Oligoflexia bacterium]